MSASTIARCALVLLVPFACACGGKIAAEGADAAAGVGGTAAASDASAARDAPIVSDAAAPREDGGAADGGPYRYPHDAAIPIPQVVNLEGGPVLAAARIVPVFFGAADPTQAQAADFVARVGASDYWASAVEYGVGPATAAAPVFLPTFRAATIDDSTIQRWLTAQLGADGGVALPRDPQAIYILFYPAGTVVTIGNGTGQPRVASCTDFGAYHSSIVLDPSTQAAAAYAVIPRCDAYLGHGGIDFVTSAASHELLEAATDPYPTVHAAYGFVDYNGSAWARAVGGTEIGDLCELQPGAFITPPALGYLVQRVWSNTAAAARHDPCVPSDPNAGPYVQVIAPFFPFKPYPTELNVPGAPVAAGTSVAFSVTPVSDVADAGPWTVSAAEMGRQGVPLQSGGALSFSWDSTTARDGAFLKLTITRKPNSVGAFPVALESTLGSRTTRWWTMVGDPP
jgi:hypothetical protein